MHGPYRSEPNVISAPRPRELASPPVIGRPSLLRLLCGVASVGALAGCGDAAGGEDPPAAAVRVRLDVAAPGPAGPPDAGTATGHGADDATLTVSGRSTSIAGRVTPPRSVVRVGLGRATQPVRVAPDGRFVARIGGLEPGVNRVRIHATAAGRAAWSREVRVRRR